MRRPLVLTSLAVALSAVSFAQGGDDCSAPEAIAGLGPHFYDNTAATKDGPNDCEDKPARKDVWFRWQAPQTGGYVLTNCSNTSFQTRIVVYDDQACPVTMAPISCAVGGCAGMGTLVAFPTTMNQFYLIRVGSKDVGDSGTGQFDLIFDNCRNIPDDSLEDNDTCDTAIGLDNGTYTAMKVGLNDQDWFFFDVADGATIQVDNLFKHSDGNIETFLYDMCGGVVLSNGGSVTDNEVVSWTNNTGACVRTVFQVLIFQDPINQCNVYDMIVQGASPPGTCGPVGCGETHYCDTNPDNVARIHITDCDCALSSIEITMTDAPAPDGNFGYVLIGASNGTVTNPPGAVGDLCLIGSTIGRYNKGTDILIINGGNAGPLDLLNAFTAGGGGNIPTIGGNICSPAGQSWNFQWWHRDGMNPSKFSDAIAVTFK